MRTVSRAGVKPSSQAKPHTRRPSILVDAFTDVKAEELALIKNLCYEIIGLRKSTTAPIFDMERTPTIVSILGNWTEMQRKTKHNKAIIEKIVV
eukprot:scaffold248440_cov56-Cyclotella_meneghiniana.AAC.6